MDDDLMLSFIAHSFWISVLLIMMMKLTFLITGLYQTTSLKKI
jgi:hypothetical protein